MKTSAPDVWAAGDAVEIPHGLTRTPLQGLTGSHAYAQGKTAGTNAGGGDRAYRAVYVPWATPAGKWVIGGASFGETTATALGIPYVLAVGEGISRARYYPGVQKVKIKLLAEPGTLRLIGAQMIGGGEGIKERADFLAQAIRFGMTLHDLATMENVYSPAIGALNEPIVRRGHQRPRRGEVDLDGVLLRLATRELRALPARGRAPQARPDTGSAGAASAAGGQGDLLAPGVRADVRRPALAAAQPDHARDAGQPPPDVGAAAPSPQDPRSDRGRSAEIQRRTSWPRSSDSVPTRATPSSTTTRSSSRTSRPTRARRPTSSCTPFPYEGSVGLVNMLTTTRINRKGFDTTLVLYGPGVLMASATRGFPTVGAEAFPGHMAYNNQLQTFMKEGGKVLACRFAMAALYGMRETDLIEGVQAIHPLDVLDCQLTARREGALVLQTWTL